MRWAWAAARSVERHVPGRPVVPEHRPRRNPPKAPARILGSGPGARRSVCLMPDLLESADPGRRSGALAERPLAALPEPPTTHAPVLLFEHVSKWYGPVIGINQLTLQLRPGITGL